MSVKRNVPADFIEWIDRALEGDLTPEQWARLDAEIATNEAACDFYVRYLAIYMGLVYKEGVLPKPQGLIHQELQDGMEEIVMAPPSLVMPLSLDTAASDEEKRRQIADYAQQKLEAYLAENQPVVKAVPQPRWDVDMLLAGVKVGLYWIMDVGRRLIKVGVCTAAVALVVMMAVHWILARQVVARVTDSVHALWSEPLDGQALRRGWLTLDRGFVRIEFARGARVILQGPCEFKLESSNRIFLASGSLTAMVPEQATGFTVETFTSKIVDYGTEFGVSSSPDKSAEVHVFKGSVGVGRTGSRTSRSLQTVNAGSAAVLDQDGSLHTETLSQRVHRFVRDLPSGSVTDRQYQNELIVYYNFDEAGGASTLTDSSGHGLVAEVMGDHVVMERLGVVGRAIEAGGDGASYITIDDHPGNGRLDRLPPAMDLDGTFSLSCWISFPNPPRYDGTFGSNYVMGTIDLNQDSADRRGICFIRKPRIAGVKKDDFVRGYDDAGKQIYGFSGAQDGDLWDNEASDGFHHYVLVCEQNGQVAWYRDNTLVTSVSFQRPLTGNFGGEKAWIFGGNADPTRQFPDRAVFDEFAVWDRVLTRQEIAHLYYRGLAGVALYRPEATE